MKNFLLGLSAVIFLTNFTLFFYNTYFTEQITWGPSIFKNVDAKNHNIFKTEYKVSYSGWILRDIAIISNDNSPDSIIEMTISNENESKKIVVNNKIVYSEVFTLKFEDSNSQGQKGKTAIEVSDGPVTLETLSEIYNNQQEFSLNIVLIKESLEQENFSYIETLVLKRI